MTLRDTADQIIRASLRAVQPDAAVARALQSFSCSGRVVLIAIGKAAWAMANAAWAVLGPRITSGAVITKYDHSRGPIGPLRIFEAGHPVPDEAGLRAAQAALELTRGLQEEDCVLFLISGGGSALFESPLVPLAELEDITGQLLACGADIVEINTIRKRLSAVKGGRFALHCRPASVFSVVLSDIIGDPLDMIASGPAAPDSSTCAEALAIAQKYGLRLSDGALACLRTETPKTLPNAVSRVTGSVRALCDAAEQAAQALGYRCIRLTDCLNCEAREAGRFLAAVARTHASPSEPLAFLAGGETVVHLTGAGRGGRNQELALAAAEGLTRPPFFPSAPTEATARPMPQAASSIRTALPRSAPPDLTPPMFCGATMPIPRWSASAASSAPAPPAQMSTTSPCSSCRAGTKRPNSLGMGGLRACCSRLFLIQNARACWKPGRLCQIPPAI